MNANGLLRTVPGGYGTVLAGTLVLVLCLVAPLAGLAGLAGVIGALAAVASFPLALLVFVFSEQTLCNVFLIRAPMVGLVLLSCVVGLMMDRVKLDWDFDILDWAVAGYAILCVISFMQYLNFQTAFEHFRFVMVSLIFFFLLSRQVREGTYFRAVLATIALAGLVIGLLGYYQFFTGATFVSTLGSYQNVSTLDQYQLGSRFENINRVNSTTFDPQDYAMYLQTAIVVGLAFVPFARRWRVRLLLIAGVSTLLGAWVLAFSRRSILCMGLAFGLLLLKRPRFLGVLALILAVLLGVGWTRNKIVTRAQEIGVVWGASTAADVDAVVYDYRKAEMLRAWELFLESPLFGKGMANFEFYSVSANSPYLPSARDFNGILLHLAEKGLIATVLLGFIFFRVVTRALSTSRMLRRQHQDSLSWTVYAAAVALLGILASAFISEEGYYLFIVWAIAASLHGLDRSLRRSPEAALAAPARP